MVDGIKPELPHPLVELEVVYSDTPIVTNLQRVICKWIATDTQYIFYYEVVDKTEEELEQERIDSIPEEITKLDFVLGLLDLYGIDPSEFTLKFDSIENEYERKRLGLEFSYSSHIKLNSNIVKFLIDNYPISMREVEDMFLNLK